MVNDYMLVVCTYFTVLLIAVYGDSSTSTILLTLKSQDQVNINAKQNNLTLNCQILSLI